MTDVFVQPSVEKTYNLERSKLRKDAKKNPDLRFHAHASVAVINKETGKTECVIKPGMVAMAVGRPVEIGETKADFLKNIDTDIAFYYVLEIVSKSADQKHDDEADAEALVIRIVKTNQIFPDLPNDDAGYLLAGKAQWIDVDKFIGVADMVIECKDCDHNLFPESTGYLIGCLPDSDENMCYKNRACQESDIVYFVPGPDNDDCFTEDERRKLLQAEPETICFWSAEYLDCKKYPSVEKKRKADEQVKQEDAPPKKLSKSQDLVAELKKATEQLGQANQAMILAEKQAQKLLIKLSQARLEMKKAKGRYLQSKQDLAALCEN